jgi:hypothetical protein
MGGTSSRGGDTKTPFDTDCGERRYRSEWLGARRGYLTSKLETCAVSIQEGGVQTVAGSGSTSAESHLLESSANERRLPMAWENSTFSGMTALETIFETG